MVETHTLTAVDVDTFWRQGFLHRRDVFAGAELAALRADLDRLSGYADHAARGGVLAHEAWLDSEAEKYFTPVEQIHEQSAAWAAACAGVLQAQASDLLETPAVIEHALGIIKPPVKGLTFPLHQDGVFYAPVDGKCVLANVYLDDVTETNGSLVLVPGSHERLWPHDETRGKKSVRHPERFTQIVMPPAQAGDVVYFSLWTVHGSPPNQSAHPRRAVRVGYIT